MQTGKGWGLAWQCLPLLMKTILRKGLSLTFRVMHQATRFFLSAVHSHETDDVFSAVAWPFPPGKEIKYGHEEVSLIYQKLIVVIPFRGLHIDNVLYAF